MHGTGGGFLCGAGRFADASTASDEWVVPAAATTRCCGACDKPPSVLCFSLPSGVLTRSPLLRKVFGSESTMDVTDVLIFKGSCCLSKFTAALSVHNRFAFEFEFALAIVAFAYALEIVIIFAFEYSLPLRCDSAIGVGAGVSPSLHSAAAISALRKSSTSSVILLLSCLSLCICNSSYFLSLSHNKLVATTPPVISLRTSANISLRKSASTCGRMRSARPRTTSARSSSSKSS